MRFSNMFSHMMCDNSILEFREMRVPMLQRRDALRLRICDSIVEMFVKIRNCYEYTTTT